MKLRRLLPLLVLAACTSDPVGTIDPEDVEMTSFVDLSAVSPGPNVRIFVRNQADHTVYVVDHCGDRLVPQLERREGGQWVHADADLGGCLAVATPPIALAPGETASRWFPMYDPGHYRSTVRVTAGSGGTIVQVQHEFTVGG